MGEKFEIVTPFVLTLLTPFLPQQLSKEEEGGREGGREKGSSGGGEKRFENLLG